ncbi:hypothetical protein [Terrisporobacter hibernicus]|uniref:Uncharacterized protein n=1 Tax=Terrisporobacter hibernicus TaxID=2813371 RepID=A0AAX2ZES5_9FIRM|nr:hypothetical protein [Terrisporobacter hibernicus]UEL47541.1 hypothetical protein JW646_18265 [Terrisporobacter hibernicus]
MSNQIDFWKDDRETLFKRAIENIKDVSDMHSYKEGSLVEIGSGFTDGDFVMTDIDNNYISIYQNYREVLKIDISSNVLVMINEILKEV